MFSSWRCSGACPISTFRYEFMDKEWGWKTTVGLSIGSDPTWLIQTAHVALLNWHYLTLIPREDSCLGVVCFWGWSSFCFKNTERGKETVSCNPAFPISSWEFNLNRSSSCKARNIPCANWSWQKLRWGTIDRCS